MATEIQVDSQRNRGLGQRLFLALHVLFLVLLLVAPGIAGGGGGGGGGSAGGGDGGMTTGGGTGGFTGGGTGGGGLGGPPAPPGIAQEVYTDYHAANLDVTADTYVEAVVGPNYMMQLLGGASNRMDVKLPGYSYFQGLIHSDNHVTIAGQVRVVGGVLGTDRSYATANLYSGAMVTTNAHAFTGAGDSLKGGPAGMKTRIRNWKEVPSR